MNLEWIPGENKNSGEEEWVSTLSKSFWFHFKTWKSIWVLLSMVQDYPGYHLLRSKGPFLKRRSSWGSCTLQGRRKGLSKWLILDFPPHFGRWRFKLVLMKSEKIKKCARHYAKYWTYTWSSKHPYEETAFRVICILQMRKLKFKRVK